MLLLSANRNISSLVTYCSNSKNHGIRAGGISTGILSILLAACGFLPSPRVRNIRTHARKFRQLRRLSLPKNGNLRKKYCENANERIIKNSVTIFKPMFIYVHKNTFKKVFLFKIIYQSTTENKIDISGARHPL